MENAKIKKDSNETFWVIFKQFLQENNFLASFFMSVSHSGKEELYDFMFVMEVGITLMELCYNLTTIALPRPTNDDSIRSYFLLY